MISLDGLYKIYRYVKWHNNYNLEIGAKYKGVEYKEGWIIIDTGNGEKFLARTECFEEVLC